VNPREVVLLGSTGSIGTQAIDIVRRNPDRFRIVGLGAGGGNVAVLAAQALELGVDVVGVARATAVQDLQLAFYAEAAKRGYATGGFRIPKILAGPDAMAELASWPCDVVLNGVVGSLGLPPTLSALRCGRTLALANKESLVAGGPLVKAAVTRPGQIVPVDSEHSALAQCLRGGAAAEVRRLVLTASGGAFRGRRREDLVGVTPEQALAHPTWDMGPVVTINSATLVNKALEVIEAHYLFALGYDQVDVVVHPQSIIHAFVEFVDGSVLAQLGFPNMELPILYALTHPERVPDAGVARFDPVAAGALTFERVRATDFPSLALGVCAGRSGGTAPTVFNAANEVAVEAFLDRRIPFGRIPEVIERALAAEPARDAGTLEAVLEADARAREEAGRLCS